MATANSKLKIDFGFDSYGTSNVEGDFRVSGNVFIGGSFLSSITTAGDFIPTASGSALGNTSNRWNVLANSGNFTNTVTITGATSLQDTLAVTRTISGGNTNITGFVNASASVNSAILTIGTSFIANTTGAYHTGTINAASFSTSGLLANTTGIVPTSNTILLGNSIGRFVISANSVDTITVQSGTINSTSNGLFANSTTISLGNSTVNVAVTTAGITSSGGSGVNPVSNTNGTALGTATQRWVLNANTINTSGLITGGAGATVTGQVNASTGFGSGTINATSNGLFANSTTISLGNTSVKVDIAPSGITSSGGTGVNPESNTVGTALGTTTQRWVLNANTGNFSGALTVSGTSTLTGNATLSGTVQTIAGNSNFDSGVLFVDSVSNRVGINNTAPSVALEVAGAANVSTSVNSAIFTVGTSFIANTTGVYHTGVVNAASHTIGSNFVANSTAVTSDGIVNLTSVSSSIRVGNSTVNSFTNSTVFAIGTGNFSTGANVGANINITTSTVQIGNSTVNLNANSVLLKISDASSTANLSSSSLTIGSSVVYSSVLTIATGNFSTGANVGANVNLTTSTVQIGNSTINLNANSTLLKISDASSTANLSTSSLTIGSTVVNSSVLTIATGDFSTGANVGANVNLTTSSIQIGNSTVNTQVNSSVISTGTGNFSVSANVGANVKLTTVLLSVGNSTVNSTVNSTTFFTTGSANVATSVNSALLTVGTSFIANTTGAYHTGTVNAASFTVGTIGASYGFLANATHISVGNSTINVAIGTGAITTSGSVGGIRPVSNTDGMNLGSNPRRWELYANTINISGTITANGTTGTAGQTLLSNGTSGSPYWATVSAGSTTSDDTTTNGTRYVLFANQTSGTLSTAYVSSTKLTYNPSTGTLTSTILTASSDERLKTNVNTVSDSLQVVDRLRGVSFDRIDTGIKDYGVIAQELEQVLPTLVHEDMDGYKSVSYNSIVGILIEAIKELRQEVKELKNGN